ncbi:MAG: trypsin-like serine protease, partial [Verrucomicrobiota bacterium]
MSIAASAMIAANASAIVVQDYTAAETAPNGLDWSHVHNYKGSSAVAVGGSWILTAGHVADDGGSGSLSIDGYTYTQQEIVYHASGDLALVRYDMPLPGYYALYSWDLVGIQVLLAGFGDIGAVSTSYWTMGGSGRGTKRWGSQVINRTRIHYYHAGGSVGFTQNYGFWMDFDLGNTSHEAGTATGDSGSGVFYNDGGAWKLAGINTAVSGSGGQYDSTFAISIPYYHSWIVDTVTAIGSDDADGDGLTNEEEEALGTDPLSGDTDNDLISDPLELD